MRRLKVIPGEVASLVGDAGRRRLAVAVGAIGLVVLVAVIVVISSPDSSRGASPAGKVSGAATVERRDLVATDTESGTLSYANPQTVYNRVNGTITSLPAVGAVVKPGGTLFDVDNSPVVLFNGTTPAYRDLDSSDADGPDILELNRDLRALGFDTSDAITVNDVWQTGTTDAVDLWQASVGETETGTISLGQIVFLPGKQEIDSIDTTVGSTGGSSGAASAADGSSSSSSYTVPAQSQPEFVSLTTSTPPATPTTSTSSAPATTTPASTATISSPTAAPISAKSASEPPSADSAATEPCNGLDVQQQTPGTTQKTTSTPSKTPPTTCSQKGSGGKGRSGRPSTEAVLLALLRAETLELKKTLTESGTGSATRGGSGTTESGGTGSRVSSGGSLSGGGGESAVSSAASGSSEASSGGSASSAASSAAATADPILQTSSTDVIVSVQLDATKQSEAKVGAPVTVEMPNGNTINGKITQVSPIAQSTSSSSSSSSSSGGAGGGSSTPSATIPVTIALEDHHLPTTGLDQAAVSVNFAQQVEDHVLSVPVTALLATAGGGYAIQEAASPHKLIPVTPGLFAAGYVQVSSSQIYSGLQVTDSQG